MATGNASVDTAAQIFLNAEVYRAAAKLLAREGAQGRPQFFSASIAGAAFAVELYLKCLITSQATTPKTVYEHDLVKLFGKLKPDIQTGIRLIYNTRFAALNRTVSEQTGAARDFDTVLRDGKDAFEVMRYFYEPRRPHLSGNWDGEGIMNTIRDVIMNLQPSWPVPNGALPTFPRVG